MYAKLKADIKRGEIFENYIESYFKRRGWSVKRAKGHVPAYDLQITKDRTSLLIETKHDIMSDETQNYCLEKASLDHTKSDYLVIGTPNEAYLLSMDEAKRLFTQYPHRQVGDFSWNEGALIPKSVFQTHYQRL